MDQARFIGATASTGSCNVRLAVDGIERHETIPAPVEKTTQKANNEGVMRFIHHLAPAPASAHSGLPTLWTCHRACGT